MVEMSEEDFEELVADALDDLPQYFASRLHNLVFLIEDEPTPEQLAGLPSEDLLGLYDGFPQTDGDFGPYAEPNKIFIFRGPILRLCETEDEVADEVLVTVFHEIAHHFGIEEEALWDLGWG